MKFELSEPVKIDFDSEFESEILSGVMFQTKKDEPKPPSFIIQKNQKPNPIDQHFKKQQEQNMNKNNQMDIDMISIAKSTTGENLSVCSNTTKAVTNAPGGIKFVIEKNVKNQEKVKKKIPFLKDFNPKFTKRENIDKKILRKFKKYLKELYKVHKYDFEQMENKDFWVMFMNGHLFPPMKYFQKEISRTVEYKSFNTQYTAWIFSHQPSLKLYQRFLKDKGEDLFNSIVKKFNIQKDLPENMEPLSQLRNYVFNIAEIFTSANNKSADKPLLNMTIPPVQPEVISSNIHPPQAGAPVHPADLYDELSRREMNDDTFHSECCMEMPAAIPTNKGFIHDELISSDDRFYDDDDHILFYNE